MSYQRRNPAKGNWRLSVTHQKASRGHAAAVRIPISCWRDAAAPHLPPRQAPCTGALPEWREKQREETDIREGRGAEQGKPGPRPPAAPSPAAASALLPTVPGYGKLGFKGSVLPRLAPKIKSLHEKKWKK